MKLRVAALAAVVLLSACGAAEDPAPSPDPAESQVVEGEGLVVPWGSEVELGGLVVVLDRPEEYQAENVGDVPDGWVSMLLPVSVTNVGDVPVPSSTLYFGGPGVESFMEYDGTEYVRPSGDVLPGRSIEWLQPIAVEDPELITVQVDHGEGMLNIEATVYIGDE